MEDYTRRLHDGLSNHRSPDLLKESIYNCNQSGKHQDKERKKQTKKQKSSSTQRNSASIKKKEIRKPEVGKSRPFSAKGERLTEGMVTKSRKYKDPLNKRLKDIIDALFKTRRDMSKEELCADGQIDSDDAELWKAVHNNQRIEVLKDGQGFRYRPRNSHITNKEQLLMHVRRRAGGTQLGDISDSYVNVQFDLDALVAEKKVFVIDNPELEDKVIFWNDSTVECVTLSEEVLNIWKETQLQPGDVRLFEEVMEKSGIAPAPRKDRRRHQPIKKQPKVRKIENRLKKITNTHLPDLFKSTQPEQIDQ